jgi:dTDP-4-amino-4,6-dideoxy-D-galactose acyltransferase
LEKNQVEAPYIEFLNWDSEFFGYPVARIQGEMHDQETFDAISKQLSNEGIQLGYYTSNSPQSWLLQGSPEYDVNFADLKVTYLKNLNAEPAQTDHHIEPYTSDQAEDQLIHLAIESGIYSRFNRDNKFGKSKYQELYTLWIKNSVGKKIAEEVLVFKSDTHIAGFVTLGIKKGRGDIGIIAVDEHFRGQRIGSRLMRAAEKWFLEKKLNQVQVVTQGDNLPACRLYEGCGFARESAVYFYHLWRRY